MNQIFPGRFASQGGEIITPPFFRRRGVFWIQEFVITPQALEQGGSEMRTPAQTFDTIRTRRKRVESLEGAQHILAMAEAKLDSMHRHSGS